MFNKMVSDLINFFKKMATFKLNSSHQNEQNASLDNLIRLEGSIFTTQKLYQEISTLSASILKFFK